MREKLLSNASKSDHQIALEVEEFLRKKIFTFSMLSRITGINQRQLQSYSSGASKPRKREVCRNEDGSKSVATELASGMFK